MAEGGAAPVRPACVRPPGGQSAPDARSRPVLNAPPTPPRPPGHASTSTGQVFRVEEGGAAAITPSHLMASDVDTALEALLVTLVQPPHFGYLEDVVPSPGFETSNTGVSVGKYAAAPAARRAAPTLCPPPSLLPLQRPGGRPRQLRPVAPPGGGAHRRPHEALPERRPPHLRPPPLPRGHHAHQR